MSKKVYVCYNQGCLSYRRVQSTTPCMVCHGSVIEFITPGHYPAQDVEYPMTENKKAIEALEFAMRAGNLHAECQHGYKNCWIHEVMHELNKEVRRLKGIAEKRLRDIFEVMKDS